MIVPAVQRLVPVPVRVKDNGHLLDITAVEGWVTLVENLTTSKVF
jgi:hypothetical protein